MCYHSLNIDCRLFSSTVCRCRLFVKGMGLNLHMSVADREEGIVIGRFVSHNDNSTHPCCLVNIMLIFSGA